MFLRKRVNFLKNKYLVSGSPHFPSLDCNPTGVVSRSYHVLGWMLGWGGLE